MNRDLLELIKNYATLEHKQVLAALNGKSKVSITALLLDLLTHYFNDKNSSSLRETVIVTLCGYKPTGTKIGYNGYRQDAVMGEVPCEAKPKNINTNDANLKKLNGGGNFTDYTWARFARDKEANLNMVMGGFIDGRLIYTFEFPFASTDFMARLEEQLNKRFPNGDKSGEFLRSASFTFSAYENHLNQDGVKVYVDKKTLDKMKSYLTQGVYDILERHAK